MQLRNFHKVLTIWEKMQQQVIYTVGSMQQHLKPLSSSHICLNEYLEGSSSSKVFPYSLKYFKREKKMQKISSVLHIFNYFLLRYFLIKIGRSLYRITILTTSKSIIQDTVEKNWEDVITRSIASIDNEEQLNEKEK